MIYSKIEPLGIELSAIGLGGHEYMPDGSSRGFNEDFRSAVKPGYQGQGYGGEKWHALQQVAYENGINFFDVTIDPEKKRCAQPQRSASALRHLYPDYTRGHGLWI